MKPLDDPSNRQLALRDCAELVIETVLLGTRMIRAEMRSGCPLDLSVPQFRMLAFLKHHRGASLSDLSRHMGLTLPSMSKTVDGLVRRGLVSRETCGDDRRRAALGLTPSGEEGFEAARQATRARIAAMLAAMSPEERATVVQAMEILRPVFTSHPAGPKCSR